MSSETLHHLAQALCRAEAELAAVQTFVDNLPVNPEHDLGIRVDLNWGSSGSAPEGNRLCQAHITDIVRQNARDMINKRLEKAQTDVTSAQQGLYDYFAGRR